MSGDEMMYTPDKWAPSTLAEGTHDHKGYSEEKCFRCGWVMGRQPLNCQNDDTPHVFPSQLDEIVRLRAEVNGLTGERDFHDRQWAAEVAEVARLRRFVQLLLTDLAAERAEIERLRAERDDHKARLAMEAVTAPDADYNTMMDSLQARLRDLHAEVDRLRVMIEPVGYGPQPKCVNDPRRSCVSWATCRMSEECYYDYQVRVSNRSGQPSKQEG